MARQHTPASLTLNRGALLLRCDYDADLVDAIKKLPATDRAWDKPNCAWAIDPKHGAYLAKIVAQHLGELVLAPQTTQAPKAEQRILEVRYIGTTKDRGDGSWSAFGWSNGAWSVIFSEQVLKQWFEGVTTDHKVSTPATLYGLLGVPQMATADEIKTAFRRMAKQWHPDYCREPNAAEMFIQIKHAYDLLGDANKRARYDAGLALEATISQNHEPWYANLSAKWPTANNGYRSPLRCGLILADGTQIVGRFVVSQIHQWLDITRNGKTLVTSWQAGADQFSEAWA